MKKAMVLSIVLCMGSVWAGTYDGGNGESETPYRISSAVHWQELIDTPDDWDKHFILINDIDFGGEPPITPVGTSGVPFEGVFDGGGNVLSNVVIDQPESDYIGLFGSAKNAVIQNLGMVNATIKGHTLVGGLVGLMGSNVGSNDGAITDCYVTGSVSGHYMVGGLVGKNYDRIEDSYSTADITGARMWIGGLVGDNSADIKHSHATGDVNGSADSWSVGGLVGEHYDGTIENTYAEGAVTGNAYVGGLIGVGGGSMVHCYASGSVTGANGEYDYILGGLSGRNYGTITACYATGSVAGDDIMGGLAGENFGRITESFASGSIGVTGVYQWNWAAGGLVGDNRWSGEIENAYATGTVISVKGVGGLVGNNSGTIKNAYSIGPVIGDYSVGGLVGGYGNTGVSASFWDIDTSGRLSSKGGIGLQTAQMQQVSTYSLNGWGGQIWTMQEGHYPRLAWEQAEGEFIPEPEIPLEGEGTREQPWLIADESDLELITQGPYFLDKHYRLTANLDLNGVPFNQIGSEATGAFTGSFDGNGFVIQNLTLEMPDTDFVGLFGFIGQTAVIRNLGLENVNITGGDYVGGLVGQNMGAIVNCYTTGSVTGIDHVGGIVGINGGETWFPVNDPMNAAQNEWEIAIIIRSHSAAEVTGDYSVGGLCGTNWSRIDTCYAVGPVSGRSNVGGLCGDNNFYGTITNSYAAGQVEGNWSVGGLSGENVGNILFCYAAGAVSGNSSVGGLCGENYFGTIRESYAEGDVTGINNDIGGLCGYNWGSDSWYGRIFGSYATGAVVGAERVGGLCGHNRTGTIRNSYAVGPASGTSHVGGLIGLNFRSRVIHCYSTGAPTGQSAVGGLVGGKDTGGDYQDTGNVWDQQASQISVSAMGTGIAFSSDMNIQQTFTDLGWDFLGESTNGTEDIWRMCADGVDDPRLRWQFSRKGDLVCPDGVDLDDLLYFVGYWHGYWCEWSNHYCHWADINADGFANLKDFAVLAENWLMASP